MSYADRLLHLGFHSVEYRRVFSDLLMCFKIVKNLVDLDASAFFHINLSPYGTRGNSIKLSPVSTPRHNFRSNFFCVRIMNIWNSLPDTVVTSSSELIFKSRLCTVNLLLLFLIITLPEAGVTAGAAAKATEERKLKANVAKCADLGWVCVPVVAESYGAWGLEAMDFFSKFASRMATSVGKSKSVVLHEIYGRLNMHIVRANSTAILSRGIPLESL